MRILLTNDDGINAPGLAALRRIAEALTDDIWTVAPEVDQSGQGRSLTLSQPLRVREIDERTFGLNGTPTDCVIMAVRRLVPEPVDLVLSGVNCGTNIGDSVLYSGTVAAAMEAAYLGIPAVALSQAYSRDGTRTVRWNTAETLGPSILRRLVDDGFSSSPLVNVNFPDAEAADVDGMSVCSQGTFEHALSVDDRLDGRGLAYSWLTFRGGEVRDQPETDVDALRRNQVAITPLAMNLTDTDRLSGLRSLYAAAT